MKNIEFRPELIFGFVGAVGTNLELAIQILKDELRFVKYESHEIKLSDLLREISPKLNIKCPDKSVHEEDRINGLMDAGNQFRELTQRGDALAISAISAIRDYRKKRNTSNHEEDKANIAVSSQAFLLNSLKHSDEVKTLRDVYGANFFLISLYAPQEKREESLIKKIKASHHKSKNTKEFKNAALSLIEKDSKQEGMKYGQSVRDAFPMADLFIKEDNEDSLRLQIKRFIKLLFGYPYITPSIDEYCMFTANATSLRSSDLSRQVGAIIATEDGEHISAGCNEVPKAGGGSFWDGSDSPDKDYRDFKEGNDANAILKAENITEVLQLLKDNGWLSKEYANCEPKVLTEKVLFSSNAFLKSSGVANAIEYGRIVHAEMAAITEAARRGLSVKNRILYCTTFPCHMCARHILACGISKVVYIEPYPKSLSKELYKRAIKIDDGEISDNNAVVFESFVGIAPRVYLWLFKMVDRKDKKGYIINWKPENSLPKLKNPSQWIYITSELAMISKFAGIIDSLLENTGEVKHA